MLSQLIREAKEDRGDLAVLWLDLTNAYSSIPHRMVEITLEKTSHTPAGESRPHPEFLQQVQLESLS